MGDSRANRHSHRQMVVLTVAVTKAADGATRFDIELCGADQWSAFGEDDAVCETEAAPEPPLRRGTLDPKPRDHIEAQSLENLEEAVRRVRERGTRVPADLVAARWREWVSSRPDASHWGAAQRMRSARSINEWVRDVIR